MLTLLAILLIPLGLVGTYLVYPHKQAMWGISSLAILLFLLLIGRGTAGRYMGVLIDERNRFSLARLQFIAWIVIVLGALTTALVANYRAGSLQALFVEIPIQLLVVLVLSATSFVGSPLIRNDKYQGVANYSQAERTAMRMRPGVTFDAATQQNALTGNSLSFGSGAVVARGLVMTYGGPSLARWSDLFKGEETGNGALLDLGKVQLFYLTALVLGVYALLLFEALGNQPGPVTAFPGLSDTLVGLLAVSHVAYLAYQAAGHSQREA